MALIEWDKSFDIKIGIIDKQHRMLVNMINDLYGAMNSGKERDAIKKMLGKLKDYSAMHFGREEHYFEMFAYPEAKAHEKEHSDFEKKVFAFESEFNEERQDLSIEMMNFLSQWLVSHIKGSDKKYAPFFRERGLK